MEKNGKFLSRAITDLHLFVNVNDDGKEKKFYLHSFKKRNAAKGDPSGLENIRNKYYTFQDVLERFLMISKYLFSGLLASRLKIHNLKTNKSAH